MSAQRIVEAWVNEGPVPAYHHAQQDYLRRYWPTLFNAIVELVEEEGKK